MYTRQNFKTKAALKNAVKQGMRVSVYQPGPCFSTEDTENGEVSIEGPHYPEPHRWYARVTLENGYIVRVK